MTKFMYIANGVLALSLAVIPWLMARDLRQSALEKIIVRRRPKWRPQQAGAQAPQVVADDDDDWATEVTPA